MPVSIENTVIRFNDGTTQSTAAGAGGVTSLNGQTGAVTTTSFNAIGSCSAGSRLNGAQATTGAGDTIAGSNIYSITSGNSWGAFSNIQSGPQAYGIGNLGRSGTWRAMNSGKNGDPNDCGYYFSSANLWMRVS